MYAGRAAFRVPKLASDGSEEVESWTTITYSQFKSDVETYASYWASTLAADGLAPRSVVGLW